MAGERSGVAVAELALLSPMFFGLVVDAVELGRAACTQGVASFAAEEATRFAMVNYSATGGPIGCNR